MPESLVEIGNEIVGELLLYNPAGNAFRIIATMKNQVLLGLLNHPSIFLTSVSLLEKMKLRYLYLM